MGILILVLVVVAILFVLGRGAGQTIADLVNTGEKAKDQVKVQAPVVAKATRIKATHTKERAVDVTSTVKTAVGVTAINTSEAAKKGIASFRESYKATREQQKASA